MLMVSFCKKIVYIVEKLFDGMNEQFINNVSVLSYVIEHLCVCVCVCVFVFVFVSVCVCACVCVPGLRARSAC